MYYDEVLTMSCRVFASTGLAHWEDRYNQTVPRLDSALAQLKVLAPNAFGLSSVKQTDAANQVLIGLETKAFELAKAGQLAAAVAVLDCPDYAAQKKIYSQGMAALVQALQAEVAQVQADHQAKVNRLILFTAGVLPIIFLAFFTTLGLIKRYVREKAVLELEITEKNRQLGRQNEELEEKVQQRTQEISTAYKELEEHHHELQALEEELRQNMEELAATQEQLQVQFNTLSVKDKNISDSINYAKRLQDALLPKPGDIQASLPNSFVLFRPRDVVSGDFYWFAQKAGREILVVADCTGHGVPGAFMSVIALEALHFLHQTTTFDSPDTILADLNAHIRAKLKHSFSRIRDGLDMAVCLLDRQQQTLEYAGARIPLYLVQYTPEGPSLLKVSATRHSVGDSWDSTAPAFDKHRFNISLPTTFYLSTDGVQDQFGSEANCRLMSGRFREMLLSVQAAPMTEQAALLEGQIKGWMGPHKQVDDMLVVGVSV
jgi:serine phosphatase RsbU (regulator of sigma subunit)